MKKQRLIFNVGINDSQFPVVRNESLGYVNGKQKQLRVWTCPYYRKWYDMLRRAYDKKEHQRNPTYKDCTVCDEWHLFSNFKFWMETQEWEGRQLDKDLLVSGNKVYSPETCIFVSRLVNSFLIECDAGRGEWPIGVRWEKKHKKFYASCRNPYTGKREHLGNFDCPDAAHQTWLKRKLELAKLLAAEQDDPRVAEALVKRYENYKS